MSIMTIQQNCTAFPTKVLVTALFMMCVVPAFLSGCSMPDVKALPAEGEKFALATLNNYGKSWDPISIEAVIDPRITTKDVEAISREYAQNLGPMKELDELKCTNSGAKYSFPPGPDFTATYTAKLTCKKDTGNATLSVTHMNNKWTVLAINIDSKNLDRVNEAQETEAKKYVDSIVPKICAEWNYSVIEQNADRVMLREMRKNPELIKGVLFISKAWGPFEKYSGSKNQSIMTSDSQQIFVYECGAKFEKTPAIISVSVVKDPEGWKVRQFNVKSGVVKWNGLVPAVQR